MYKRASPACLIYTPRGRTALLFCRYTWKMSKTDRGGCSVAGEERVILVVVRAYMGNKILVASKESVEFSNKSVWFIRISLRSVGLLFEDMCLVVISRVS